MIFTFGYGNRKNYDLLSSYIEKNKVEYLIDVRINPRAWTRKWYGQQIADFCDSKGVIYINEQSLGNTSGKSNWISPNPDKANRALADVAEIAKEKNVLLLCAEMDFNRCHRTEVAKKLGELTNTPIEHLK